MGHVFISYTREDREYVNDLAQEMKAFGLDVWFDRLTRAGSDKAAAVAAYIAGASSVESAELVPRSSATVVLGP